MIEILSRIEMDQTIARRLLFEGATLVVLDVPVDTEFGIDLKSWNVGNKFKGIKMIPPGFHYVHYSAVNKFGETSPKIGFLHVFEKAEFMVKRWDQSKEEISSEPVPENLVQSLKENLKDLDKFLGPYPYNIWKGWNELTDKIDYLLIERCAPVCGFVHSALELEPCSDALRPRGGDLIQRKKTDKTRFTVEEKEEQLLPDLKPIPGTELRLSQLPEKHYPDGATPTEITKHSLDSSYVLDIVLNKLKQPIEIIGEIQLAFVCLLVGQNLDAFEHWKKLISLICGVDSAISSHRYIYMEFLKVIEVQLSYIPEDILWDIVTSNNFVYQSLRKLFANIELNSDIDGSLKCNAVRVRDRLTKKFRWDFTNLQCDNEDEAPVVVSLE
ncbi:protein AAR2 homolog isoform X1 [Vespa crabro]|uniref:protein AAR2 homolog isoform X1 n=1 Tax=Vespa crabro TaxID=7445 RepID=UPI001EFFF0E5|nr:protein AAR2 homolog isoform X1 [Vespa crabro]